MRRVAALALACLFAACGLDVVGVAPDALLEAAESGVDARPSPPRDTSPPLADATDEDAVGFDAGADVLVPPSPVPCSDASIEVEGRCYTVLAGAHTQQEATALCAEAGAGLPTIRSADDENRLAQLEAEAGTGADQWLGLSAPADANNDAGAYFWLSGDRSTYRNWNAGDPNGNHPCVRMIASPPHVWGDQPCETLFAAVCERDR